MRGFCDSDRDGCDADLEMRQYDFEHGLKTAAFWAEASFVLERNVAELHRRTGVAGQAETFEAALRRESR